MQDIAFRLAQLTTAQSEAAAQVYAALDVAGGRTRLVGGCVRDALLGHPCSDLDLATQLLPDQVIARIAAAGLKAVPTGLAHGTVTVVAARRPFEVTTLREDVATNGRHATVAFTQDWARDAMRRDFTINALSANPLTGALYDYTGGQADLAAGVVRFIGDPATRIAEDHLRILRFFRFSARYAAGALHAESLAACIAARRTLQALSRERIRDELLKLLVTPKVLPTLAVMFAHEILVPVLPELLPEHQVRLARLIALEPVPDPLRRFACLLPDSALEPVAKRLHLSRADQTRMAAMSGAEHIAAPALATLDDPAALRRWAYDQPNHTAIDRLLRAAAALDDPPMLTPALAALSQWTRPKLPLRGADLIARGLTPGPQVSRALQAVQAAWVAADFPTEPHTLDALAHAAIAPFLDLDRFRLNQSET